MKERGAGHMKNGNVQMTMFEKHTKCRRCLRVLRNPISMAGGYGPVCKKKIDMFRELLERQKKETAHG